MIDVCLFSMKKPRVYLAGKLTGRDKKEVFQERKRAILLLEQAGLDVFDPASIEKKNSKDKFTFVFPLNQKIATMASFVKIEKEAIQSCDALVVLTGDDMSDGSWMEMSFALYKCNLPVVLISKLRYEGRLVSWSNIEATALVPSIDVAIQKLKEILERRD